MSDAPTYEAARKAHPTGSTRIATIGNSTRVVGQVIGHEWTVKGPFVLLAVNGKTTRKVRPALLSAVVETAAAT